MTDPWVARDADGTLKEFDSEPDWWASFKAFVVLHRGWRFLPKEQHPDLKPGECRRLVMEEETSE